MDEWETYSDEVEIEEEFSEDEEAESEDITERLLFVSNLAWTVRRYCHERCLSLFNRPDIVDIFLREFV